MWPPRSLLIKSFLNPKSVLITALIFLAAAASAFRVVRQGATSVEKSGDGQHSVFTISDNVNLVLLDVLVKKPGGGFIKGLRKDNFSVFEDGRPRAITEFANIDTPVSIGLVVDNSGSMVNKKPEVIMAGLSFAHQSNSHDEFFVVNFNNSVVRGLPPNVMFTDNVNDIRSALYYGKPAGQTALYDAIAYSLGHLEYAHFEKRTLIVVSDGGDNVSTTKFPELMKMIEASRASIYAVGIFDPEDPTLNRNALRKIATVSGGEYFEPSQLEDILPIFNKISQDIRNSYTVGYVPDTETDHRVLRNVKVVAQENGRKLSVHTRTSYVTTRLRDLLAEKTENGNDTRQ